MIRLDCTPMLSPAVPGGVSSDELDSAATAFRQAHGAASRRRQSGEVGFFDLPGDAALLRWSTDVASRAHEAGVRDVVVLGIGGSALGPIALWTALRPSVWNDLSKPARGGYPRRHVVERSTRRRSHRCWGGSTCGPRRSW